MQRVVVGFMVLGVLLANTSSGYTQLATEVDLRLLGEGRRIDGDSRLNPDNNLLNLGKGAANVEARLTVSDYLNERKTMRWLFKEYSFYSSAADAQNRRRNLARVDELFADWKAGNWFVSVGKRRTNWGTAMAFNPVNVMVPPRDPLNPGLETEGQPVAWLSFNRSAITTDLFFTRDFDKDWNSDLNRWGARLGVAVGEWDVSGYYFDGQAYGPRGEAGDGAQDGRDYERMLGLSFSGNVLAGATLYSEMAGFNHNYRKYYASKGTSKLEDERYVQGVVGSYMVLSPESFLSFFSGDASLTLEAYYNGGGYAQSERKYYFEALDQARGNPVVLGDYRFAGMSRCYFLAVYRNAFKERYTTELSGLVSQDRSFSLQAQVQYNLSDCYMVKAKLTHNRGDTQTEFGNAPVSDVLEISLDITF